METIKNTIENNKIIAEFMEFKQCSIRNCKGVKYDYFLPNNFILIKEIETTIESQWCEILEEQDNCMVEDLKFNSDWNWLMEVVDKIETTSFDITKTKPYLRRKESFKGTTSLFGEFIISYDNRDEFKGWTSYVALGILPSIIIKDFDDRFNTKIEAYYNACIEFIKWHNSSK